MQLRLLATSQFSAAKCAVLRGGKEILRRKIDLTPDGPQRIAVPAAAQEPVEIRVSSADGQELARFTTPLPIPKVLPPSAEKFKELPDEQLSVEQVYLKGEKFLRASNRLKAREYCEKALVRDAGYLPALRALAVLDFEAALYPTAIQRLEKALDRYSDDGLSWYFLGREPPPAEQLEGGPSLWVSRRAVLGHGVAGLRSGRPGRHAPEGFCGSAGTVREERKSQWPGYAGE